jgi:DNA-binding NarL/FixJ family response regulator
LYENAGRGVYLIGVNAGGAEMSPVARKQRTSRGAEHSSIDPDDRVPHIKGTRLTKREQEIVAALLRGCANKEIARELGVSDQTVKNQLTTLFRKVGLSGRLELVASVWRERRK